MRSELRERVKQAANRFKEAQERADRNRSLLTRFENSVETTRANMYAARREAVRATGELIGLKSECVHSGIIIEYSTDVENSLEEVPVRIRMCLDCGWFSGPNHDGLDWVSLGGEAEPVSKGVFRREWEALNPDSDCPLDKM
jgi:hypothetical protein